VAAGAAPGAAFVPWNQRGFRANALFRGSLRIGATIEAAAPEEVAS
jgi:hypothetical protein